MSVTNLEQAARDAVEAGKLAVKRIAGLIPFESRTDDELVRRAIREVGDEAQRDIETLQSAIAALESALSSPAPSAHTGCVLLEDDPPDQHGEPAYCVTCYNAVSDIARARHDRIRMLEDLLMDCNRDLFYWIDWQKWRRSRSDKPSHDPAVATLSGIQQSERIRERIQAALRGMDRHPPAHVSGGAPKGGTQ